MATNSGEFTQGLEDWLEDNDCTELALGDELARLRWLEKAAQGHVEGRGEPPLPKWPGGCSHCDHGSKPCSCPGPSKAHLAREGAIMANVLSAPDRGAGDPVTLPIHYARYKIEPIRFICENKLDFFQGNVVKYIVRHDAKNGQEDIKKVIRYATMYLKFLDGDPDWWKAGKPEDLPQDWQEALR